MRHWCIPLTYEPKIEAVFNGSCRQTIRKGKKFCVGDRLTIYTWAGKPYRSKWARRMKATIVVMCSLRLWDGGFRAVNSGLDYTWDSDGANALAQCDGIVPPTGLALRDTLKALNGKDWEGKYQVIVWHKDHHMAENAIKGLEGVKDETEIS